jgi:hypothetical protein
VCTHGQADNYPIQSNWQFARFGYKVRSMPELFLSVNISQKNMVNLFASDDINTNLEAAR